MAKGNAIRESANEAIAHESASSASMIEPQLDGLMAEERRTQILQIVRTAGRAKVNELSHLFNTSAVTIRNDLNELHQRGLVVRSHGGAMLPDTILREGTFG